jgi:hypothetical protein
MFHILRAGPNDQFVICNLSFSIPLPFLDFAPLVASFPGFEAPVAQLDRVYDFGS